MCYPLALWRRFVPAAVPIAVWQAALLLVLAFILATVLPTVTGISHLDSRRGVDGIIEQNLTTFLASVSTTEMIFLQSDVRTVIIDARWPEDYALGHIGHAVNLSPNSSIEQCALKMESIPHSQPIVVYCLTRQCPYSASVARKLVNIGYTKVRLYREGYAGWSIAMKSSAK